MSDALIKNTVDELEKNINNAGSATAQEEYEKYYWLVFKGLDEIEKHLEGKEFLFGEVPNETDEKLFDILVRFDVAYYFVYRLNERRIRDYKNIWGYAKRLYKLYCFRKRVDFEAIKKELFAKNNPLEIYPLGVDNTDWEE